MDVLPRGVFAPVGAVHPKNCSTRRALPMPVSPTKTTGRTTPERAPRDSD